MTVQVSRKYKLDVLDINEDKGTAYVWIEPVESTYPLDDGTNWEVTAASIQKALGLDRKPVAGDGGIVDLSQLEQIW